MGIKKYSTYVRYKLIIDPHNDLLPVGLIAQLVDHCTGIAKVIK